jgi:hypothetical protein
MALPILCLAITACGKPDARAKAADPNTPAVVRVPPPILASDTARKEVEPVVTTAAELTTSNGKFTGQAATLKEYQSFGMDGSGTYTVVRKRDRADSTVERGAHASVWRIQSPSMEWVMTQDHLYPVTKKKR